MRVRVPVFGSVGKAVRVDRDATIGATLGTDLKLPNGNVGSVADFRALLGGTTSTRSSLSNTLWSLVREIPANVQQVQALNTVGLVVRQTDGSWITRALAAASARIVITDGDGDAAAPTIDVDETALSILETQIPDGALLARVADDEVIVGNWQYDTYVDFGDIGAPAAPAANTVRLWADNKQAGHTFLHWQDSNGVEFEIGRDLVHVVRNTSGTTLPIGSIVYVTGAAGNVPTVDLADATNVSTMPPFGVTVEEITNNTFGRVMQQGDMVIDTSAFAEGDELFVSETAGQFTATEPAKPAIQHKVGTVLVANASGKIAVQLDVPPGLYAELDKDEEVTGAWTFSGVTVVPEATVTDHEAAIDHDALLNFVAAEHIDWSVTGAEDIHVDRVTSGAVTQHEGDIDHDALTNFVAAEHVDWSITGAEDIHVDRVTSGAVTQHEGDLSIAIGRVTGFTDNSSNWNTAYGWGGHSGQGYLTSVQAGDIDAEASTDGYVLTSDGAGNAAWEAAASGGVTDHGALTGLADNDHPQYARLAIDETVTGNWLMGDGTDISPTLGSAGQLRINGNAYRGYVAMDATGMHFGHNSSSRNLTFDTDETARMSISGSGAVNVVGALTAATYGGITEANLLDKTATETVSGEWTFSGTLDVTNTGRSDIFGLIDAQRGLSGSYGDNSGTGSTWGANIWAMGDGWAGGASGSSYSTASKYGMSWLRGSHSDANSAVGEGLYVHQNGTFYGGIGTSGIVGNRLRVLEAANAFADVAGWGQVWVKDTAPNELWFTDDSGEAFRVAGTKNTVQNGNYTLTINDAEKVIRKTSGGAGETYTIPANSSVAFPVGTAVAFSNLGGGALTIAITTDTLIMSSDGSTGSRTLANNGLAVAIKVASTTWKIAGDQLT